MPKPKSPEYRTLTGAFQGALDALDVIGNWSWDAASDCIQADMFVALLFNVDPEEAEAGLPLGTFGLYAIEYRVRSADGVTRWVLGRGRFLFDHRGRPVSGSGIIVDITDVRMGEMQAGPAEVADLRAEPPLERAADFAMAAHRAICELQDPALKARAEALLLDLGRRLAEQERRTRRAHMN
ncbi:MAG: hypothetical protein K0Q54_4035 [Methylobacterium brachiatum]|nr:hypothetical protein [Methylobacterium brachiatum]